MSGSFSKTEVTYKGRKIQAGEVWKMRTFGAWGDCLILGFDAEENLARVSRPYAYVSLAGICPTILQGAETFEISVQHLAENWTHGGEGFTT